MEGEPQADTTGPAVSALFLRLRDLQQGAEAFAVLLAAHRAGLTRLLATPTNSETVSARLGFPLTRVDAVLDVLASRGIVDRRDDLWALPPPWHVLAAPGAAWDPSAFLELGGVHISQTVRCLDRSDDYWIPGPSDRLAVAYEPDDKFNLVGWSQVFFPEASRIGR